MKSIDRVPLDPFFGIDELMDMARTSVNLLGNCLATVVIARWEGEFNDEKAEVFGTDQEILDPALMQ